MKVEEEYLVALPVDLSDKYNVHVVYTYLRRLKNGGDCAWYIFDDFGNRLVKVSDADACTMMAEEIEEGDDFPNEIWF